MSFALILDLDISKICTTMPYNARFYDFGGGALAKMRQLLCC